MAVEINGVNTTPLSDKKNEPATTLADKVTRAENPTAKNARTIDGATPPSLDKVTLTKQAEELRMIEEAIGTQVDIDKERIASLKLEIDAGRYDIDTQRVAEKLIEFESLFVA
ncbi:MAG TPA: flagellar biosynthesis anti-sigma factor FlgM [Gammaproteobacteria bacterium]|nr:flagellar biosynthesis anti-sigma factor FlgM [Gammaproteobacteria bacterium]